MTLPNDREPRLRLALALGVLTAGIAIAAAGSVAAAHPVTAAAVPHGAHPVGLAAGAQRSAPPGSRAGLGTAWAPAWAGVRQGLVAAPAAPTGVRITPGSAARAPEPRGPPG